jgi:hypothetical protein
MNAKERKREKRKAARAELRVQATNGEASINEALRNDAALKIPEYDYSEIPNFDYAGSLRTTLMKLVNDALAENGNAELDVGEYCLLGGIMEQTVIPRMAIGVQYYRDVEKQCDISGMKTELEMWLVPKVTADQPHEEAVSCTGAMEEAAEDSPAGGTLGGSTDEPQVCVDDETVAATTQHQPDPRYKDLWEGALRDAKARCNLKLDDSATKTELHVHASACQLFRIRKKRFKDKNKGHDRHVVAKVQNETK